MSNRAHFLASLARRLLDGESDSDSSEDHIISSSDSSSDGEINSDGELNMILDAQEVVLAGTPPRSGAIGGGGKGLGKGTSSPPRPTVASSLLGRRRSSLLANNDKKKAKPVATKGPVANNRAMAKPWPLVTNAARSGGEKKGPLTSLASINSEAPRSNNRNNSKYDTSSAAAAKASRTPLTMKQTAENFHRRKQSSTHDNKAEITKATDEDEQNTPPRRGAHHTRRSSFDAKTHNAHHVRRDSLDAKSSAKTRKDPQEEQRRFVELPKNFKSLHLKPDGTLDIITSASSEWDGDVSVAVSVASALSVATSGSTPPVAGAASPGTKSSLAKLRRLSGRGGKYLDDRVESGSMKSITLKKKTDSSGGKSGSGTKASSKVEGLKQKTNLNDSRSVKAGLIEGLNKKAYLTDDDASTVTAEATSYSRSNDSQTSKQSSSVSKELNRLKRLSIGAHKPKCDPSDDASVATTTEASQASERRSSVSKELNRLKRLSIGGPKPKSDEAGGLKTDSRVANNSYDSQRKKTSSGSVAQKKKAYLTNNDTSTVATEATSLLSISYSRSNDSQTSERSSVACKEFNRRKRLSIVGARLKPKSDPPLDDATVVTSEEFELSIVSNKSETSELSDDLSHTRLAELHRLKKLKNISSKNGDNKKSLDKYFKEERNGYGNRRLSHSASKEKGVGNISRSLSRSISTGRIENKGGGSEAGKSKTTETIEQESKAKNAPMTPVFKRAMFRERSLSRSKREMEAKEQIRYVSTGPQKKVTKKGGMIDSAITEKKGDGAVSKKASSAAASVASKSGNTAADDGAKPILMSPVSRRAMFRGQSMSRSSSRRRSTMQITGDNSGEDMHATPPRAPTRAPKKGDEKKATPSAMTSDRCEKRNGKDSVVAVASGEKKVTPSIDNDNKATDTVDMLSRARQRRSRSLSRNSRSSTPPKKSNSFSPKRVAAQSSSSKKSKEPSPKTPPRNTAAKGRSAATKYSTKSSPSLKTPPRKAVARVALLKTPPRTMVAVKEAFASATPVSPLIKSSPKRRWSTSLPPSPTSKSKAQDGGAAVATRSTVNHFDVLRPSKLVSLSIAVLCRGAIPIQCLARQYLAKVAVEKRKEYIVVVQSLSRRWTCVRYLKSAQMIALRCQGAYQGMIVRDQLDFQHYCASRIQTTLRGFLGVLAFKALGRIILIQSIWRMQRQRKRYSTLINVTLAQSIVRRWIAMKSYKELRETKAALMIQTNFRRHRTMLGFFFTVSDVILCQAAVRRFLALKHALTLRYTRDNKAALIIQTNFRRHMAMDDLLYLVSDVSLCQATVRRFLALKHAATLRHRRDTKAALLIQTNFRRHRAMVSVSTQVLDVILCQATMRRFLALKHTMQLREMKSATKIQATWRRYLASKRIILENEAATAIQTCFRRYRDFMSYVVMNFSVIQIQDCMRGHLAKCLLKRLKQEREKEIEQQKMILQNEAATAIQSCFRGYQDFERYLMADFSIIQIQTRVRGYQARYHLQRLKQENQEEKRIVLQNSAATAIQTCFRGYRDFVTFVILQYFVNKTQACIRGNQARCRLKRSKQEDVNKQIKECAQFSDVVSRVPIAHTKTNRPRAADDVSLSSVSFSSSRGDLSLSTLSISPIQKERTPTRIEQKKEVAVVIERLSEIEITLLEQEKLTPKCKGDREGIPSSISSACSFSGYRETPSMHSPRKEPTSDSHPPSGFKSAYHNSGQSRRAASGVMELTPLEVHPSSVRRRKDTGAEQTLSPTSVQALLV